MKVTLDDLRQALMKHPRASGAELCRLLEDIDRSTLMRLVARMGDEVVLRGGSRRALRERNAQLPMYRIDATGEGHTVGALDLAWPEGCALTFGETFAWPLDGGRCATAGSEDCLIRCSTCGRKGFWGATLPTCSGNRWKSPGT